jgi:peptidylprolyl isomerase
MHNDMVKKSYWIIALLAFCGVLIFAVATWLGPHDANSKSLGDASANSATTTPPATPPAEKTLPAPLKADELAAYNVDMTNKSNPVAVLTTNKGEIDIELFKDTMPITAGNFIKLAEQKFYDGTKFHRVIKNFMIQGGDPYTKTSEVMKYGTGGPGYAIQDEFVDGKYLTNVRGTIAMANSGPNTGGSQFFINLVDNKALDWNVPDQNNSQHPVFGQVVKGMNIVDAIGNAKTGPRDMPTEDIVIEKVEIRKP